MKPEDIERVKDLLPTSLGSDEIREHFAADILRRSVFTARMVIRPTESPLTAGVVQARLSLKSLSLRPTEPLFSLYLLDLGVDTQKAHARKTRPFQPARRYALRLGDLAILKRPLDCFQPRIENIRLYGIATILDLVGVVNQLRSWRQCLANGDNIAETATLQRLGVARRLGANIVKIGLNIKPNVVFTDLLPALHGSLLPEEKLNPPRMAVTNAAWNRQTPYETGRGYYFHDLPSAAEVRYFLWCHNAKMIPQTTVERQAVHGADYRLSALLLRRDGREGLFKFHLELGVLLPNVAGVEISASNERVMTDQPRHEKRHGNPVEFGNEVAETIEEFVHDRIITRKAA